MTPKDDPANKSAGQETDDEGWAAARVGAAGKPTRRSADDAAAWSAAAAKPAADAAKPAADAVKPAAAAVKPAAAAVKPAADAVKPAAAAVKPAAAAVKAGLSGTTSNQDLRAAVGVAPGPTPPAPTSRPAKDKPKDKPVEDKRPPGDKPPKTRGPGRNRRTLFALAAVVLFLTLVLLLWGAGLRNSRHYYIRCGNAITAERGRSFPPWGTHRMSGAEWRPIELIVELSRCDEEAFTDRTELEARYRDLLLGQADEWLRLLTPERPRDRLEDVRRQLEQAATLSRASGDPNLDRIRRLFGDVEYWQAHDELLLAQERLSAATDKLREAVQANPAHARDADLWRGHIASLGKELTAGPAALRPAEPGVGVSARPNEEPVRAPRDTVIEPPTAGEPALPVDSEPALGAGEPPREPVMPNPPPPGSGTLL